MKSLRCGLVSSCMIHLLLHREGRWGSTDDFRTISLHFSLFSTVLLDLANSGPVHSLILYLHLFLCLPCLLPPFTVPYKVVLARPGERETCSDTTSVCVSLLWSGLRVVRLPAGLGAVFLVGNIVFVCTSASSTSPPVRIMHDGNIGPDSY